MARTDPDTPAAKSGPVTLRLGDLEPDVQARRREGESAASVVRRDLERYYRLLNDAGRREPTALRPPEIDVLAMISSALNLDAGSYRYLWAEVEQTLDILARAAQPPFGKQFNRAAFVQRLKDLSLAGTMALLDKIEQYRLLAGPGFAFEVDDAALVGAGLVDQERLNWWREQQRRARARRGGGVIARADTGGADEVPDEAWSDSPDAEGEEGGEPSKPTSPVTLDNGGDPVG